MLVDCVGRLAVMPLRFTATLAADVIICININR